MHIMLEKDVENSKPTQRGDRSGLTALDIPHRRSAHLLGLCYRSRIGADCFGISCGSKPPSTKGQMRLDDYGYSLSPAYFDAMRENIALDDTMGAYMTSALSIRIVLPGCTASPVVLPTKSALQPPHIPFS